MDALDNRIKELVAYARTRDGEDRSTLFRNLIDLFLTGKAPSANHTRNQLLDVIEALIPHVDAEARRTAADLLSNMTAPPTDLAIRLCRDRASLVGNLLKCAHFDEDDILDLIGKTGREHHQILASREDLSANVWIALARAAPSAPPFDHQSTLALWSDDLGILQINETADNQTPPTTNVTPLHIDKNKTAKGSIRIIKTGDDLIAERSEAISPEEKKADTVEQRTAELKQAIAQETAQSEPQHNNTTENISRLNNPELNQFLTDDFAHKPLKDPGPGGWAWHTDRDGLVISLSPKGIELLGETNGVVGASVLDMLGLNTKIGHPVARAFQRRSTIHDAPITLQSLDKPFQHWTLEATPVFSSCGGIFEGYEGILTPVVPSSSSDNVLPSEDEANAMFLDDITPAKNQNSSPKFNRIEPVRQPDYTPKPHNTDTDDTDVDSIVGQATATAVKEILNEALGPLTGSVQSQNTKNTQAVEQKAESTSEGTQKTSATLSASQVLATLDLLDEALKRLTEAAQHAPDHSVRLQGEIATACSRSLREQLSGK